MIRQVLHQEYEMANETKSDRDNPAFSRFDDKTLDQLEALANTLRDQGAAVDALVAAMKKLKIKSLRVDGATKDGRGVQTIWDFITKVEQAISKKKYRAKEH